MYTVKNKSAVRDARHIQRQYAIGVAHLMYQYTSKDAIRFWLKVNKNGSIPAHRPELGVCWEWTASLRNGYGQFGVGGRKGTINPSHRVSWELTNGAIPNGLFVLHKCDNPKCCRPKHLFLGTHQDNMKDMTSKFRHGVKLNIVQVDEIRRRYFEESATKKELAIEMGVSVHNISDILKEDIWKSDVT